MRRDGEGDFRGWTLGGRAGRHRRSTTLALSCVAVLAAAGIVIVGNLLTPQPQPPVGGTIRVAGTATPAADAGRTVTSPLELLGSWWTVQLDGGDVTDVRDRNGNPLFLRFSKHNGDLWWSANDGCNYSSGRYTVTSSGHFSSADPGGTTLVACPRVRQYPGNPEAVSTADEARIDSVTAVPPRLVLLRQGRVLAAYTFQPGADPQRPAATVLTSGPPEASTSDMTAEVTGKLTRGTDHCLGLDGQSTVFPQGTSWAPALGLLILPDGGTARLGDIITGVGGHLSAANARQWVREADRRDIC